MDHITCSHCGAVVYINDKASQILRLRKVFDKYAYLSKEERLKKEKKDWKIALISLGITFIGLPLLILFINLIITEEKSLICSSDNNDYYITIKENKIFTCTNCNNNLKDELEQLIDYGDLNKTQEFLIHYFVKKSGSCTKINYSNNSTDINES